MSAATKKATRTNVQPALSLNPRDLAVRSGHGKAWCYEERGGILVVTELRSVDGVYLGTLQVMVPRHFVGRYLAKFSKSGSL